MVLSYDLLEKSERGDSVAVQLPYDLLTVGETIEYTTYTIGLETIGARPDSRASVYNGEERLMAIRAFYYDLHVRRKVSGYKKVGGAGLANELVICALVNFFYMVVSPFASKTKIHVSGVFCSTIRIWFKYKDSENSIPTYITS